MADKQLFFLPPPPRSTGSAQADYPLIVDWLFKVYQGLTSYVQSQTASDVFNPGTLPDPGSTNLASAQQTANQAYTLANTANTHAASAQTTANTGVTNAATAQSTATAAGSAASAAQSTANASAATIASWHKGQLVVSGAATSAVVTFGAAEADTNYRVSFTPTALSGGAAAGSNRVLKATKTVNDITLNIETAPGVGESATFDYLVLR